MRLRSGGSIGVSSHVSTEGSGTRNPRLLTPIPKETTSETSESPTISEDMAYVSIDDLLEQSVDNMTQPQNVASSLLFNRRLLYVRDNKYGANLFSDPENHFMVKMEDIPSPLETEVWFNFQGHQYMSLKVVAR